jgi:hypothetical protein
MLYLVNKQVHPATVTKWKGEPIDGAQYPLSIETLWTAAELKNINLYIPKPAALPKTGTVVTSTTVKLVKNVPTYVDTTAPVVVTPLSVITKRNSILAATDFAMLADTPFTASVVTKIKAYRVKLRDLTAQASFPSVTWPTPPAQIAAVVSSIS